MLIPPIEILEDELHFQFKAEIDIALKYQIDKTIFFCKSLEETLDKVRNTHYLSEAESSYYLDSIIHNHSMLIEYYYSWIILSLIGTLENSAKIIYRPIRKEDIESKLKKIFKKHSIGVLRESKNDPKEYYDKCKHVFMDAFQILLISENHELYVLNNYLKHNRMSFGYAPIIRKADQRILETVYALIMDIIKIQRKYQKEDLSLMNHLDKIEKLVLQRAPKTLARLYSLNKNIE